MPAVFAFGLNPQSGPGLVFETLPYVFSQMPAGGLVAIHGLWVQLQSPLRVSSEVELVIGTQGEELSCTARCPDVCASAMACGSLGATQLPDSRSCPVLMPGPSGEDVVPTWFSFPSKKNAHCWKIIHNSAYVSKHLLVLVRR